MRLQASLSIEADTTADMILLHRAVAREGGKGQIVRGEGIWEGKEKLEAKMCFIKINLTGTCRVSRIKYG